MEKPQKNSSQVAKKERKPAAGKQPQGDPPMKIRKFVLTKVSHVRSNLAQLFTEARNRQLDVTDASKLANLLAILHRVITDSDLEARISEIEKQLEGKS